VSTTVAGAVAVEGLEVGAYEIPTEERESDATLTWDSTTIVVVHVHAGGERGLGYTYGDACVGQLIEGRLAGLLEGRDALRGRAAWADMRAALRNVGQPGVGAMALSAVDVALWDLEARLLGVPLAALVGALHDDVPIYGSGGFTSYDQGRLEEQLAGWAAQGIGAVKMKVGRHPPADRERVRGAREAVGEDVELMVDANGGYRRDEAARWAAEFAAGGVRYLEEPLSSEDLEGLRWLRERAPAGMAIAAGEYHWSLRDAERMLAAQAVDILQADVTRCGGITELLRIGALAQAHGVGFSAHCAPAICAHACTAIEPLVHLEYFHDHVRLEAMLFDGVLAPEAGRLRPDVARPGLGLELKRADAEPFAL